MALSDSSFSLGLKTARFQEPGDKTLDFENGGKISCLTALFSFYLVIYSLLCPSKEDDIAFYLMLPYICTDCCGVSCS